MQLNMRLNKYIKNTLRRVKKRLFREGPEYWNFSERMQNGAFSRPNYAYGIWRAACEAKELGFSSISAIEFGVAGGNGLVAMEDVADAVTAETGVKVEIFGFDTGAGMPKPCDYRDLPHIWQEGIFAMDVVDLKKRLRRAQLVLGEVKDTVLNFVGSEKSPIGFIAFDLDYYSSTVDAFEIFSKPGSSRLPRVFCYFDDMVGDHWESHCEFFGEWLAIIEYNKLNGLKKIARINGLEYKFHHRAVWHDLIFVHHDFVHPLYCRHINPKENWHLPLAASDE
jgi:hypothetical protein